MRVLIFAPHFAEYATRLAVALSEQAQVLLVVERSNREQECESSLWQNAKSRCKVLECESLGRWNKMRALAAIVWRCILFRPDFISMQEQIDSLTAAVALFLGHPFPILLTVHDPRPHSGPDSDYVAQNQTNRATIRKAARAFHVHGNYCAQELQQEMGTARAILDTPHGVLFTPEANQRREPEPGTFLMFGRMEPYKGLSVLTEAIDILNRRKRVFKAVIAGSGSELQRLKPALAQQPNVEIIDDYLTPCGVAELFQRCAFAVVPYLNATQSGVVAAAYGNDRPVIASRVGGLVDAVEDGCTGLLVLPQNAETLAAAIEYLLQDTKARKSMSETAGDLGRGEFSWSSIATKFTQFAEAQGWTR